jgi:nucleoside-diphosphate-sugar epimerase
MSTMVTGGLGYVGRHLVARLARDGERVVSYNRDFADSPDPRVVCVQGELFDVPRLVRTLEQHGVERIAHTAAMSHPELSIDFPVTTFAANVDGTVQLLEAARLAGVRRIVNFSSHCSYGHIDADPIPEDAPLRPNTPYGVTKVATELMGSVYRRLYGVEVVSLRVSEVYGPGNRMHTVLTDMLRAALDGEPYALAAGGEHRVEYIHVDDAAEAGVAALNADDPRQDVYNITGGRQVTLADAADVVRAIVPGASIEIGPGHIPTLDRQGRQDITAAGRDLGYRPRWALEDGVRAYADWLRAHPY